MTRGWGGSRRGLVWPDLRVQVLRRVQLCRLEYKVTQSNLYNLQGALCVPPIAYNENLATPYSEQVYYMVDRYII